MTPDLSVILLGAELGVVVCAVAVGVRWGLVSAYRSTAAGWRERAEEREVAVAAAIEEARKLAERVAVLEALPKLEVLEGVATSQERHLAEMSASFLVVSGAQAELAAAQRLLVDQVNTSIENQGLFVAALENHESNAADRGAKMLGPLNELAANVTRGPSTRTRRSDNRGGGA